MTSKELVLKTMRGENPGRTPVYGWVRFELEKQITEAFGSVENFEDQLSILKKCIKKQLSVRQVEDLVKKLSDKKEGEKMADEEYPETYTRLVEYLEKFFNQDISIKKYTKG